MAYGRRGKPSNMQLYGKNSVRLRFGDGNIVLGLDPQMDELFKKINSLERGTKFKTVATWLLTGAMMEVALPVDQVEEMRLAAAEIMSNFVVD